MTEPTISAGSRTAVLVGASTVTIWGMSSAERLRRQLERAGVTDVRAGAEGLSPQADVLILRLDWAYEQRLIDALAARPGACLVSGAEVVAANVTGALAQDAAGAVATGQAPEGTEELDAEGLGGSYNRKLRKREIAYLIPLSDNTVADVEDRSFAGSYKGVTDVVTKYVWPRPAQAVTKWCAERAISPNQVTYLGAALMFLALFLFWNGNFLAGLIPA